MTKVIVELTGAANEVEFAADVNYGFANPADLENFPQNDRIWIDLNERHRKWVISDAFFTSEANYKNTIAILEDDNTMTLKVRRGDGSYNYYDGVNYSWTVGCVGAEDAYQMDYVGDKWRIPRISLVQAG